LCLLTDAKDSTATKRVIILYDKIIAQGGGPVLGLFSQKTLLQLMDILKERYKSFNSRAALC
jgi:SecD/SecF fusion protein